MSAHAPALDATHNFLGAQRLAKAALVTLRDKLATTPLPPPSHRHTPAAEEEMEMLRQSVALLDGLKRDCDEARQVVQRRQAFFRATLGSLPVELVHRILNHLTEHDPLWDKKDQYDIAENDDECDERCDDSPWPASYDGVRLAVLARNINTAIQERIFLKCVHTGFPLSQGEQILDRSPHLRGLVKKITFYFGKERCVLDMPLQRSTLEPEAWVNHRTPNFPAAHRLVILLQPLARGFDAAKISDTTVAGINAASFVVSRVVYPRCRHLSAPLSWPLLRYVRVVLGWRDVAALSSMTRALPSSQNVRLVCPPPSADALQAFEKYRQLFHPDNNSDDEEFYNPLRIGDNDFLHLAAESTAAVEGVQAAKPNLAGLCNLSALLPLIAYPTGAQKLEVHGGLTRRCRFSCGACVLIALAARGPRSELTDLQLNVAQPEWNHPMCSYFSKVSLYANPTHFPRLEKIRASDLRLVPLLVVGPFSGLRLEVEIKEFK